VSENEMKLLTIRLLIVIEAHQIRQQSLRKLEATQAGISTRRSEITLKIIEKLNVFSQSNMANNLI